MVGSGSGGAVIAARLAQSGLAEVTVLEAGAVHDEASTPVEISGPDFLAASEVPGRFWPSLSAIRCAGQAPRLYRRGRGIGGSSAINAMVALPGSPADYDEWERRYGCEGWGWADVAPWFGRTALTLSRVGERSWGDVARAAAAMWPSARNGVDLTRGGDGRRVSVHSAYLEPALAGGRLHLVGDVLVDRVEFAGRRAVGVVAADGRTWDADMVVVSAGAIHSPALLLRSDVDTPDVGVGLQDHPSVPLTILRHRPADVTTPVVTTLATLAGPEGPDDLQMLPMEHVGATEASIGVVLAAVMRVHSRGSVCLSSRSPHDDPVVDMAMLSDERDVVALRLAVEQVRRFAESGHAGAVGGSLPLGDSDEELRATVGDYVHAAGTCAMGRVVDTRCKLRGYDGVFVVDASVMPHLPRANTHLPTVMIAERVAAMLVDDLGHGASDLAQ